MLAETKLRQAQDTPAPPRDDITVGLRKAVDALIAVGAIDAERAEAIVAEFSQALDARSATPARRSGARSLRMHRGAFIEFERSGPASTGPALADQPPPIRVIPVGRPISFLDDDRDGMYLTALVLTPDSAHLAASSWTQDQAGGVRDHMLMHGLTARYDTGAACHLSYNGAGTPELPGGRYELDPFPPSGAQWLDVTARSGQPPVRISLTGPSAQTRVRTETASASPAELLLHRAADRLLAYWEPDRKVVRSQVTGLGDTVAVLAETGALPPGSELPGQLAALCDRLGVTGHGITATPRSDLPETWHSVAQYHQRGLSGHAAKPGFAAFAAALPEIDGVRYAVTGLQAGYDQTWLHAMAAGRPASRYTGPLTCSWWLRDDTGQWHVAVVSVWDESYQQMLVVPPLTPETRSLELVLAGQNMQVRVYLSPAWWSPSLLVLRPGRS